MKTIGARLKEERQKLEFNQEKFASFGGVQRSAQINYESNKRRPDSDYLHKIALIGADINYIITGNKGWQYETNKHSVSYSNYPPDKELSSLSLDESLKKVIDDYIRDDVLTTIVTTVHQVLNERNKLLDKDTETRLIVAAQEGYDQLAASGRTEKFSKLLLALIDATLAERNI